MSVHNSNAWGDVYDVQHGIWATVYPGLAAAASVWSGRPAGANFNAQHPISGAAPSAWPTRSRRDRDCADAPTWACRPTRRSRTPRNAPAARSPSDVKPRCAKRSRYRYSVGGQQHNPCPLRRPGRYHLKSAPGMDGTDPRNRLPRPRRLIPIRLGSALLAADEDDGDMVTHKPGHTDCRAGTSGIVPAPSLILSCSVFARFGTVSCSPPGSCSSGRS
jgi:hypothetical protein